MKRLLAFCAVVLVAGCHEGVDYNPREIQSLDVELDPSVVVGTEDNPNASRTLKMTITAKRRDGSVATDFTGKVQGYAFFLGTLTPGQAPGVPALFEVDFVDGVAADQTVMLNNAFGPSSLWFEDMGEIVPARASTFAAGATPTLWYRYPFLADTQEPLIAPDPRGSEGNFRSKLEGKQIRVNQSKHGADGRLVVTATGPQAYNVSDVKCGPGGTPPCTFDPYSHMYVFTFGKPPVEVGSVLAEVRGGLSEFFGFTELSFPRQDLALDQDGNPIINPALVPAPILLTSGNAQDNAFLEGYESALVEMRNVKVCAPEGADDLDRWERFGQFEIDLGAGCGRGPTIQMNGVSAFDALANDGLNISHVVGWLRNNAGVSQSSGSAYSFFGVTLRSADDMECAAAGCKGM